MSFEKVGVKLSFSGDKTEEIGRIESIDSSLLSQYGEQSPLKKGDIIVGVDPKYYRPTEVELLIGDASKARNKLNWKPTYDVRTLCAEMVEADIEIFKKDELLKSAGFSVLNQFE